MSVSTYNQESFNLNAILNLISKLYVAMFSWKELKAMGQGEEGVIHQGSMHRSPPTHVENGIATFAGQSPLSMILQDPLSVQRPTCWRDESGGLWVKWSFYRYGASGGRGGTGGQCPQARPSALSGPRRLGLQQQFKGPVGAPGTAATVAVPAGAPGSSKLRPWGSYFFPLPHLLL